MTSDVPNTQMTGVLPRMSRDEAALYGTPQDHVADRQRATLSDAQAIETMEWMAADWERARAAAEEACANGVAACRQAIDLINESRAARGLPALGTKES